MNSTLRGTLPAGVMCLIVATTVLVSAQRKNEDPRPKLTLKAQPNVGIAPGKSEIRRRYTVTHTFRAGGHKVWVRLKRNDKVLASANVLITIQPGRGIEDEER